MTFAILISRLLDPMWVIPAVTITQTYQFGFIFTSILMVPMLGIPLALRLLYNRSGWDISERRDRPKAIVALLMVGLVTIFIARFWDHTNLVRLFVLYEVWMVGYLVISFFWKISGHAGGITLATGLIIIWYGWTWWPLLLLIPLVGWARVASKNHTVAQVVLGTVYSFVLLFAYETWASIR